MLEVVVNDMLIKTNLHPRDYKLKEVYRIVNPEQAKRFIKHGRYPIDQYVSMDSQGRDIIVYIFLKQDVMKLKKLWDEHKLD